MSSSKRLSDKKEFFTLSDINEWVAEAYRMGMPPDAIVRANVTFRGRIREIWASDQEKAPTLKLSEHRASCHGPIGELQCGGHHYWEEDAKQEASYPEGSQDTEPPAPYYIPRQQLTPNGPLHGGFTVVEGKPGAETLSERPTHEDE